MSQIHPMAAPRDAVGGIFAMTAALICSPTPRAVPHAPGLVASGA